jgi:predicted Fe-Mo cluster-binding NifX family protein
MKIAIATNDRKTIAKRTGRAKEFAFFDLDNNGNIINVRFEENQHKHDDEDEHHHNEAYHRGHGSGQGKGLGRGRGHGRGLGHGRQHSDVEHHHHHEHGEHHHNEIIDQMKNVDILLVRAVGKYLRQDLINGDIPFKTITKGENIEDIVLNYWHSIQQ